MGDVIKPVTKMGEILSNAPALMAELTEEFMTIKDFNNRAKIRLQMKAILDLLSVNTDYPPIKGNMDSWAREKEEAKRNPVIQNESILEPVTQTQTGDATCS